MKEQNDNRQNHNIQPAEMKRSSSQKRLKDKDKQNKIKFFNIQVMLFLGILVLFFFIGILFFFRPSESALEKRKLTEFPSFKTVNFVDGSYFNQISTWYSDTFPMRELLITLNTRIQGLYGIHDIQVIDANAQHADDIPDEVNKEDIVEKVKEVQEKQTETITETEKELTEEEIKAKKEEEKLAREKAALEASNYTNGLFIVDDAAYGFYGFNEEVSNVFINMLDYAQKSEPNVNIYNIIAPTAVGVVLDKETQKAMGASDQEKGFAYINDGIKAINPKVKTVDAIGNLLAYKDEYLFFRTDHHWTQRGAYYAYEAFAKEKGVTPIKLEDMERQQFDGFLGTTYANSNQNAAMRNNPDYVETYRIKSTNLMQFYDGNSQLVDWHIITDVSEWDAPGKYNTFVAGDQNLSILDNPDISDGKNAILIKDSYGNAFAPFLMAHYDKVFVVDYRYFYKNTIYNDDIHKLISENNVGDVIIMTNAESVGNPVVPELIQGMW